MIQAQRQKLLQNRQRLLDTRTSERKRLARQVQALAKVEAYGTKRAVGVMRMLHAKLIEQIARNRQEYKLAEVLPRNSALKEAIVDLLLVSHALGYQDTLKSAGISRGSLALDLKDEVLPSFNDASPEYVARLREKYGSDAFDIIKGVGERADKVLRNAITEGVSSGLHFQGMKERVATAMDSLGLTPANSYSIENIVRTQGAIAFQAGKWQAENKDPDIAAILWGYRYATVGDDRVRPEHEELDGITLPKDDPFWDSYYPPNGYSCRCQAIALFSEQEPYIPDELPLPDEGFEFNPGKAFSGAGVANQNLTLPPAPAKPARIPKAKLPTPITVKPAPAPVEVIKVTPEVKDPSELPKLSNEAYVKEPATLLKAIAENKELEAVRLQVIKANKETQEKRKALEKEKDKIAEQLGAKQKDLLKEMNKLDRDRAKGKITSEEWFNKRNKLLADIDAQLERQKELRIRGREITEEINTLAIKQRGKFLDVAGVPVEDRLAISVEPQIGYKLNEVDRKSMEFRAEQAQEWLSTLTTKRPDMIAPDGTKVEALPQLPVTMRLTDDDRCHAKSWNSEIYMHPTRGTGVYVHEIVHCIENLTGKHVSSSNGEVNTPLKDLCDAFKKARVEKAGTKDVYLKEEFPGSGYKPWETGNKDSFLEAFNNRSYNNESSAYYAGKTYDFADKDKGATEILTMGAELMYNDPVGFAERDPEYFNFVLGALRGTFEVPQ